MNLPDRLASPRARLSSGPRARVGLQPWYVACRGLSRDREAGAGDRRHRLHRRPPGAPAARRAAIACAAWPASPASSTSRTWAADPRLEILAGDLPMPPSLRASARRLRRGLLPRPLDDRRRPGVRRARPRAGRARSRVPPRRPPARAHRLPRRPRRDWATASASTSPRGGRSRRALASGRVPVTVLARRDDHRLRIGVVRDPALPRRAAARHGHAALGQHRSRQPIAVRNVVGYLVGVPRRARDRGPDSRHRRAGRRSPIAS